MMYSKILKSNSKNLSYLGKGYDFDNRYICNKSGKVYLIKKIYSKYYLAQELVPYKDRNGYYEYVLTQKDGSKKHVMIHRLVALLFIPNKNKLVYTYVNHIDHDKSNNNISNLEWVTPSQNIYLMHKWYKDRREIERKTRHEIKELTNELKNKKEELAKIRAR